MSIKPIETIYKGYRFRRRPEARWAVFFDTLGIEWEYEKEGYELSSGVWYLPDFWLPVYETWAEVKPDTFTDDEMRKCRMLTEGTEKPCLLLVGMPDFLEYDQLYDDGMIGPVTIGTAYADEHRFFFQGFPEPGNTFYFDNNSEGQGRYSASVQAARSARFDHRDDLTGSRARQPTGAEIIQAYRDSANKYDVGDRVAAGHGYGKVIAKDSGELHILFDDGTEEWLSPFMGEIMIKEKAQTGGEV